MRSRMERYEKEEQGQTARRSNKNQELYENIGRNTKYTNFTDVTNANAFDLGTAQKNYRTREGYHQIKEYNDFVPEPKVKKELDEFNYLYQDHENKVYDINSVIREAKKNRIKKDEMEAKRKLKNTNYNILASLNPEELEKYRKEKVERTKPDEEELRELIDTITSKTLAGEIDQQTSVDLLSDLMATNMMDRVEKPQKDEEESPEDEIENELEDTEEIEEKLSLSKCWVAAEDYGEEMYPYGFELHYIMGKIAEELYDDNTWFLKAECTITNEYNAEYESVCEIKVTGTTDSPQIAEFIVY